MLTKTFCSNSLEEFELTLTRIVRDEFTPTLAIAFCSPHIDILRLIQLFSQFNIQHIGCTSAGEICDAELFENKISVLLFDINQDYFKLDLLKGEQGIYECAKTLAQNAKNAFKSPAIFMLGSGLSNDGEEIVRGVNEIINNEFPVFGGLAGDNLEMQKTSIFCNNAISENGLSGIFFNSEYIDIQGVAESGWKAIGVTHEVTSAKGNILYTINNEPAADVFTRYFGYFDTPNLTDNPISTMSAQYPLQVQRADDYTVLRAPIMTNKDGSMVLVGAVKNGDKFRFSMSPGFSVINSTIDAISHWKNKQELSADALILVSCKGRHAAFGPMLDDEIAGLYKQWQKPMIGFLSYGEIGNLNGKACDFHNETCCMVTIREKF